jgi:hypothetical protein
VSDPQESVNRIKAIGDILWGFMQDLAKVQALKKRPSLEQRLKVAHAVSQLAAAYLKVAEADAVMSTVPDLKAQVQQLLESRNGHGPTAESPTIH